MEILLPLAINRNWILTQRKSQLDQSLIEKKIIILGSRQRSLSSSYHPSTNYATDPSSDIIACPTPIAVEKEKSANPSGFPYTHPLTNPSFESSPDMVFLTNHEKMQLVLILRPVHLSWVLVVRNYIRGLIIPHPRAFELFKNGSFLFPTI